MVIFVKLYSTTARITNLFRTTNKGKWLKICTFCKSNVTTSPLKNLNKFEGLFVTYRIAGNIDIVNFETFRGTEVAYFWANKSENSQKHQKLQIFSNFHKFKSISLSSNQKCHFLNHSIMRNSPSGSVRPTNKKNKKFGPRPLIFSKFAFFHFHQNCLQKSFKMRGNFHFYHFLILRYEVFSKKSCFGHTVPGRKFFYKFWTAFY